MNRNFGASFEGIWGPRQVALLIIVEREMPIHGDFVSNRLDSIDIFPSGLKIEQDYGISRSKYTSLPFVPDEKEERESERDDGERMEGRVEKDGRGSLFHPKKPLNENSIGKVRRSWKNDYLEPIFNLLSSSIRS